jgi:hypothetical protein
MKMLLSWVFVLIGFSAQSVLAQQTHLLVIVGLGGNPTFTEQFHGWAASLIDVATSRYGIPADNVTYLGEKVEIDPELIADRSTRDNVAAAIQGIADQSTPADHVAIVFFGHGSFTDVARLNLPGRDPSAEEFAGFLEHLGDRRITFVNTASASGPFVEALSAEGRVIMTATKTGRQWNAAIFGGYFVDAFTAGEDEADQNKDQRISMLEAFTYARLKVTDDFEAEGTLQTEHALLDDNGDGVGVDQPDPLTGDGRLARTLFLTSGEDVAASRMAFPDDPELRVLYEERTALEARVEALRVLRSGSTEGQYAEELQTVLVELALKGREIRQLEQDRGAR